jgi:hypothetical protein
LIGTEIEALLSTTRVILEEVSKRKEPTFSEVNRFAKDFSGAFQPPGQEALRRLQGGEKLLALLLRYPADSYLSGSEKNIMESPETMTKFFKEYEFSIYFITPAEYEIEGDATKVIQFTHAMRSGEFEESRPKDFAIPVSEIDPRSLFILSQQGANDHGVQDFLRATKGPKGPTRGSGARAPGIGDQTPMGDLTTTEGLQQKIYELQQSLQEAKYFADIGQQTMRDKLSSQVKSVAGGSVRALGAHQVSGIQDTHSHRHFSASPHNDHLHSHTTSGRFGRTAMEASNVMIPSSRSDKVQAIDASIRSVEGLFSLNQFEYLLGAGPFPNLALAGPKINAVLRSKEELRYRSFSADQVGRFISFDYNGLPKGKSVFADLFGENSNIAAGDELDEAFEFAQRAYAEMGSEWKWLIQGLRTDVRNLIRGNPIMTMPHLLDLIDNTFREVQQAAVMQLFDDHAAWTEDSLGVNTGQVKEMLSLTSSHPRVQLVLNSLIQENQRAIKENQQKIEAKGNKPTSDDRPARTKPKKGLGGGGAPGGAPPAAGTTPKGLRPRPPHIPGNPMCYFFFKSGHTCCGATVCSNTGPGGPRSHAFPPGTSTTLQAEFIAWVHTWVK